VLPGSSLWRHRGVGFDHGNSTRHFDWNNEDDMDRHGSFIESVRRDDGQTLVEYAFILILVAILAIAALQAIGGSVADMLNQAAEMLL
jgi:Flp pilus assembly pilin Flp